jgi:hypothetical protein
MKLFSILVLLFLPVASLLSQVRIGWRSIYDTSGRLTRMNYYENGMNLIDSSFYFQYYTDNVIKGILTGDISREEGCKTGSVMLFDESGDLKTYSIKRNGQLVFNLSCEDLGLCTPTWGDQFEVNTGCWIADSSSIENNEFVLYNKKGMAVALYNPPIPVDITGEFVVKTRIPKDKNSSKLGICLGWKDPNNYFLFEISFGGYYSVLLYENGICNQLVEGRKSIEKENDVFNELKISGNGSNLILEINQRIEMIIPKPRFQENTIGLITRSKGNARFMDFVYTYTIPSSDPLYTRPKIGRGSGFFITSSGKILTTYDVVAGAKNISVRGMIKGKLFLLPAEIVSVEEERNIAILQIKDRSFKPFDELPYGYTAKKTTSELSTFSIGFPNSVSGIYMKPEIFTGKNLPAAITSATDLLMEMPFRYGMIGSPVFDNNANLIGILSNKGMEMKYSEVIDFFTNSHLLLGYMGRSDKVLDSPIKDKSIDEKYKLLSEVVVIVESNIFDFENKEKN